MELRGTAKTTVRESAKGCAVGCLTHFLIGIAAAILIGGGAHYWGLSGRAVFVIVLVVIFFAAVLLPWEKHNRS
jgi:hypothetical protein